MFNWYDIVTLYEDVISTSVDESDFVIDLQDVISGQANTKYQNPKEFFQRTHITRSVLILLEKISAKLLKG